MYPKPFPVITPQSYVPGGGGGVPYGAYSPSGARGSFPVLTPNSYLPPMGSMEPPMMNLSGGGGMFPPPTPYAPMARMVPSLPQMQYPNQGAISMMAPPPPPPPPPPSYDPGYPLYSHRRRPVRLCRRRGRRSRRSRPVLQIIDSSSCSSLSSCTTISSCSRRRHRSRTRSRRRGATPRQQQQQQQPIIVLPVQCQQPQSNVTGPIQQQPQQIILPPLQYQQSGQCQPQQYVSTPIQYQPQQLALPPIPIQQHQQLSLPQIQFSSSNLVQNAASSPMSIPSGQPMIQPSMSLPQIANIGQPLQMQPGTIQYIQAVPSTCSSPLQYITSERRSTAAPQRILVNSTKKNQSSKVMPIPRSVSAKELPQNDLKFGRRPFDWYASDKKNNIINDKVQVGQRGSTAVR
ncbi:unnamed protein product [Rotaria magnacalcarata]|uniref:Uncharacterized protein n=1 Tax=Rotaria magnacalcarata TaxID=392030 RepID=A0A816EHX8_9BILA|nr:unnamed protein product [Rotaria magnacalcarata]CAF1653025.1 unnamed protein product [Rotaria magnacalcarata]CAF2077067.1 unnamed protein product [Rotaria magnacalcarata]CAF3798320.1 unnamed protein product [Rotaria magnacalcarata]CAF3814005.1 unnamed protein product [Rotaria magnacalcarata]